MADTLPRYYPTLSPEVTEWTITAY